ncbi:hypothetical protein QVD17_06513 [Tagetes erecta]|uniref:IMS import disulfide relay-system CHCH-CHCH-like Cx9C domain-containing protein n=1 Tax=Tagetes erecta TaxID=13708 RepID=A0AAD8LEC8_TARER|nr:hypothetical protein QVD17_06513 [Tagetes erecta]
MSATPQPHQELTNEPDTNQDLKNMGKKAGELHINAKKFGGLAKPCMKDMMTYLGCLSLNHNSDDKCSRQRQLLDACMETQTGKKRKPWGTLNYHLQRLNRGRK